MLNPEKAVGTFDLGTNPNRDVVPRVLRIQTELDNILKVC